MMTSPVVPVDLMTRCLARFAAGMQAADDLTLHHEAERLEALPSSPAVIRMRRIVVAEQHTRRVSPAGRDASPPTAVRMGVAA